MPGGQGERKEGERRKERQRRLRKLPEPPWRLPCCLRPSENDRAWKKPEQHHLAPCSSLLTVIPPCSQEPRWGAPLPCTTLLRKPGGVMTTPREPPAEPCGSGSPAGTRRDIFSRTAGHGRA